MGFLSGLIGNASQMEISNLEKKLEKIILADEEIEEGYNVIRDYFVFTDKRLILVDKQGLRGKKVEYHSIPYKSIRQFSVESAGTFSRKSELKIWIADIPEAVVKNFNQKNSTIFDVQKTLASHILK